MNRLLVEIINSKWLIDKESAYGYRSLFLSLLNGEKMDDKDWSNERSKNKSFVVNSANKVSRYSLSDANIPEGSTAVIPIRTEIMKYDQACGPRGTLSIQEDIKQADSNAKIQSIVLVIDSPGGQVTHTDLLAETIANSKTPIVAYVEGLAASAAYWIASATQKIIASSELDRVGSIGTMLAFADVQPAYEKMGVIFHELYATKSTDKNKDINDVLDGKYDNYRKNTLDPINEQFHAAVKKNRPNLNKDVLTGKVYFAPDAIKMGLIDEIGTMDYAIEEANRLGSLNNSEQSNTIEMKIKVNNAWKAIVSFFGFDTAKENELTEESVEKLNAELESRGDKIAQLESEIAAANTAKEAAEKALTEQQAETARVQKEFDDFKAADAEQEAKAKKEKDDIEKAKQASFDNASYNQQADKILN